uniref:Uncharacterized protein n=1 Tax=Sphaerodactylus townsendi TaxID=933632 RepID=A0ACB8GDH1_9SAUR
MMKRTVRFVRSESPDSEEATNLRGPARIQDPPPGETEVPAALELAEDVGPDADGSHRGCSVQRYRISCS